MKFSISTYSYSQLSSQGKSVKDLIALAASQGFDGVEFVEFSPEDGKTELQYAAELRSECEKHHITPVCYCVGADFLYGCGGDLEAEIERLKGRVDVAEALGVKKMRHDTTGGWRSEDRSYRGFDDALPRIIEGARAVTEYAAGKGIRTMTENHGRFSQESIRVEKIVNGVQHENFGLLIDVGNFLCADEDPAGAVGRLAPYAFHVHAKDFLFKSGNSPMLTSGFFGTRAGNWLRGTIIGHGIVPVYQCLNAIKDAGYDDFVSIEFEGMENCVDAAKIGLDTLRKMV